MRLPVNLLGHVRKAAAHRPALLQAWDILVHKLRVNIGPSDYYDLQFYEDRWSWAEKSRCLGYNGSRYWPYEGNSLKFERLFSRKGMQKALLEGLGLPTPKLLGLIGNDYPISTLADFRCLLSGIDGAFVIKPDGSLGGDDVMVLRPAGDGYRKGNELLSAEDIWSLYEGHLGRGMIVEERAENHPLLAAIYPASLNTLRVISIQTRDRRWHHLHLYLRVGRGAAQVDNSMFGGLMVKVEQGVTRGQGWACNEDKWFEVHPDTGARFDGVELPFLPDALSMVDHACRHFGFMRTIGWDIALTPTGAMIIEANAFWNSKRIQLMIGPVITPEIAPGLQPRAWYTPWDRTHMYPNYREHHAGGLVQRWHARRRSRFAANDS